jgi:hypothetical protein
MAKHIFPYPTLTPIIGKPTAASIIQLQGEISANARSLTNRSTNVGHLGMVLPPAEYISKQGVTGPYVPPAPPGPFIMQPGGMAGGDQHRMWMVRCDEHETWQMGMVALKQQMLDAVEETWTHELKVDGEGYDDCTPESVFTYLKETYGVVSSTEASNNRKKLHDPWDEKQPIGNLWVRANKICNFAAYANVHITASDKLNDTVGVLRRCPKYKRAIETWADKPDADHTWANLVDHFNRFERNEQEQLTAEAAGYHGTAYAATENNNEMAAAVSPDKKSTSSGNAANNNEKRPSTFANLPKGAVALQWCHSCGLSPNMNHTSHTCTSRKPNHDLTSTFWNMKGGSQVVNNTSKRKYGNSAGGGNQQNKEGSNKK